MVLLISSKVFNPRYLSFKETLKEFQESFLYQQVHSLDSAMTCKTINLHCVISLGHFQSISR